jgi:hypothetical protein|tara:strand:+ start:16280 stop:16465 length:186 start_codon:yes stop_codon:yes gene_type:complete
MSALEQKISTNPLTTDWLKEQIVTTKSHDVVSMINETEALLFVLRQRFVSQSAEKESFSNY